VGKVSACFCQIMARSAAVACAETPSHSHAPGNIWVRVRVSFKTEAVRSAILATAGLLVPVKYITKTANPVSSVKWPLIWRIFEYPCWCFVDADVGCSAATRCIITMCESHPPLVELLCSRYRPVAVIDTVIDV